MPICHPKQLTLGKLLDALRAFPDNRRVMFDFGGRVPGGLHSYRGYYEDLALGHKEAAYEYPTVAEVLAPLASAIGRDFTGYKGGRFNMHLGTAMWVDASDEATGTAIVGVIEGLGAGVVILTAYEGASE